MRSIEDAGYLVHANVTIMGAQQDAPVMADFVNRADEIDALARASPGFVSPTPSAGAAFSRAGARSVSSAVGPLDPGGAVPLTVPE